MSNVEQDNIYIDAFYFFPLAKASTSFAYEWDVQSSSIASMPCTYYRTVNVYSVQTI